MNTHTLIATAFVVLCGPVFAEDSNNTAPPAKEKPNVLFIAVDDLNHWVGHFGRNKQTKTPNIDRLAAMGVTFTNAQCAAPVCNPSRTALLSGKRPGTTGVYDNGNPFVNAVKPAESLVMQFKDAGYKTMGIGKLWHGGLGWPQQWSVIGNEQSQRAQVNKRDIGGIAFGVMEGGDDSVSDTSIANFGMAELAKSHDVPFFLTLGFHKPHMPWNVPQKYFDMHPLADIQLPPTQSGDLDDIPAAGLKMAKAAGDHAAVLESGRWKEAVQAYLATISYLDGQVGGVLDAYDKSPEKENTMICFWGDHGWHLGEKQHWRKFALWEEATRAPFIWVVPGVTKAGGVCKSPVDFMSVYPTLCDLANIEKPTWLEGENIKPLLANPSASWDKIAITTFGQNNHAIRTDRWRYIRYANGDEELYDHQNDEYEWTNLASKPELAALKSELAKRFPTINIPPVQGNGTEGDSEAQEPKAKARADRKAAKSDSSSKP